MTISFQGHVEKMEQDGGGMVKLTLCGAMARSEGPIVVRAYAAELGGLYLPGVSVQITIHPLK